MSCNHCSYGCDNTDHGPNPYATNILCAARENDNFRTALWTGSHLQITLMSIPVGGEIGLEKHAEDDQCIRVEGGKATVRMGKCKGRLDLECTLNVGDAVFVPAGTWHNVLNAGSCPLKLSSIYAPPHHPWGTVQPEPEDSDC